MVNIGSISHDELVKRCNFRCKHKHNGIDHPMCFEEERGLKERIGYLDIETSDLKGDYGMILTYSILPEDSDEILCSTIKQKEMWSGKFDRRIVSDLCKDLAKFDRLITFYGARFDIPFIRTRALRYNIPFPGYADIKHTDVFDTIKRKFKLRRRSLQVACDFFQIPSKNHPLVPEIWWKAIIGHPDGLAYMLEHNQEDVVCLKELWHRVNKYSRYTKSSI